MLEHPTAYPIRRTLFRGLALIFVHALFGILQGCATTPPATTDAGTATPLRVGTPAGTGSSPIRAEARSADRADRTVAVLIEGEPVTWATLSPLLAEAAGGEIVDELALEHALRKTLKARGMTVGQTQIDAARDSWLALLEDSGVSAEAETEIRRRRGLGDDRFRRLLWRNAALRALVDPSALVVSESEIGLARAIRTGRRYLVTGVITRDSSAALAITDRIRSSLGSTGGSPAGRLWTAAQERDFAPFRSVVSPLDPAFPESIRRALPSIGVGSVSAPIALDRGFAVVVVDGVIEGVVRTPGTLSVADESADAEIRRELTIRKTRVAMERLARSLIEATEVNTLDRSLGR